MSLPDFRHPKTFLWIASGADRKIFLKLKTKANVQRIHQLNKVYRIREDAKLYAERCAKSAAFRRAFFGKIYNKRFIDNLLDARETETPIIIVFCGELAGGAKSFSANKLAAFLDPSYDVNDQLFMNEDHFTEAAAAGKLLPDKTYIFDDPDNRSTGAGVIARRERLEVLLRQAARFEKTDFLFCSAVPLEDSAANYKNVLFYLESIGKDQVKDRAYFMLFDRKKTPLGLVTFKNPMIDMPDLISDYLEIKREFTSQLLLSGGRANTQYIESAALQVAEHEDFYTCINPRDNSVVIGKLAALVYELYPDSDKVVSLITRKIQRLAVTGKIDTAALVKDQYGAAEQEIFEDQESAGFIFNETAALERLGSKDKWQRNVDLYMLAEQGLTQDKIAEKYAISQVRVSQLITKVKGELSRLLGAAYEKFLVKEYKLLEGVTRVVHGGGLSEPDIIVTYADSIDVISAKCYKVSTARASINIKLKEILPEIETAQNFAKQGAKVRMILDYLNYDTRQRIQKEINFNDPQKTYSIKSKR
jgi:predicted XRE-type DNA-binding protein